jgi:prefoldin subunit 5
MDAALATAIASMGVALITAGTGYAASRAAKKAEKDIQETALQSSKDSNAATLEAHRLEQAYERARKFDIETIERQDKEIQELREENDVLEGQVAALRIRVAHLEGRLGIQSPKENGSD